MKYIIGILSYIVSAISGLLIFILVVFVCGFLFAFIFPEELSNIELNLMSVSTNIPSLIAIVIATTAATHTFRASRRAGILRWHNQKGNEKIETKSMDRWERTHWILVFIYCGLLCLSAFMYMKEPLFN